MSEPFIAEIRIFAGNFAPSGWAFCDGQLMPISQNTALFSLVGTNYGGDGRSTFGLPNLQGRAPMHPGQGPGLTPRQLGESVGSESVTLSEAQTPSHTHPLLASPNPGEAPGPNGESLARGVGAAVYGPANNLTPLAPQAIDSSGGGLAHNNLQPYLTLNFIIALVGIYPSRG